MSINFTRALYVLVAAVLLAYLGAAFEIADDASAESVRSKADSREVAWAARWDANPPTPTVRPITPAAGQPVCETVARYGGSSRCRLQINAANGYCTRREWYVGSLDHPKLRHKARHDCRFVASVKSDPNSECPP